VGGVFGLIACLVWVVILLNPWPWWTIPLAVIAGAAGFIVLRILLRQIVRLVRIATYFIIIAVLLVIGAGGILLLQTLTRGA
jgi:H+/Cl- antiporter ClcA